MQMWSEKSLYLIASCHTDAPPIFLVLTLQVEGKICQHLEMSSVQLIAWVVMLAGLAAAQISPPTARIAAHVCKAGGRENFFDGHVLLKYKYLVISSIKLKAR